MPKLTVLGTIVVFLFAVAAAIDFQTSTILGKPKDKESKCEKQIQKQLQLFSCQRYLMKSTKMSPPTRQTYVNEGSSWREEFPLCCEQLEKVSEQCRCGAVDRVLQQLKDETEEGALEGVNMEEMLQTAQSLPMLCRLKPQYCYLPSGTYEMM